MTKLSERHYQRLKLIDPSWYSGWPVFPAKVTLKCGTVLDSVAFIAGEWPWRHHDWTRVQIDDISEIEESQFRLPSKVVEKIKRFGEAYMGGVLARLEFADGTHQDVSYLSEGPMDFICLPPGKKGADVIDVKSRSEVPDFGAAQFLADLPTCYFENYKEERNQMPNKTDAGNGSYGICRVIDASRSPSPDPKR
jgi:hypothetical protein